jgi:hypothetical protein
VRVALPVLGRATPRLTPVRLSPTRKPSRRFPSSLSPHSLPLTNVNNGKVIGRRNYWPWQATSLSLPVKPARAPSSDPAQAFSLSLLALSLPHRRVEPPELRHRATSPDHPSSPSASPIGRTVRVPQAAPLAEPDSPPLLVDLPAHRHKPKVEEALFAF